MDLEQASAQIDVLIERRSKEKARANDLEEFWKESERKHKAKLRRENRAAWFAYFCRQANNHRALSESYERRAEALCSETKEGESNGCT